jgi:thiamine kinase-like enzyme
MTIGEKQLALSEHAALMAWKQFLKKSVEADGIEVLKQGKKCQVYRLTGVGVGRDAIIAKRSRRGPAVVERTVYEEFFPHIPLPVIRFHGLLCDPEDDACWLFFEDAGENRFLANNEEHRTLAARWLSVMHVYTAKLASAARLPTRGTKYYFEQMKAVRDTILRKISGPAFEASYLMTLRGIVSQFEHLETCRSEIEAFCAKMPQTLVHGDLANKNIRIRHDGDGKALLILDWEMAGWGVPAPDLEQFVSHCASPDLITYWLGIRESWPQLDLQEILRLAELGTIFRLISAIEWASQSLEYDWIGQVMRRMQVYELSMAKAIKRIRWM